MIPNRFMPSNFTDRHLAQMQEKVGTKVKVLVNLKPVERTLQEDSQGFYISLSGQRVAVRPDSEMLNASHLVGLVVK